MSEDWNARREIVQDLSLFRLPPSFRGRSAVVVQLWWIVQATLFRGSPQFMYGWRRLLLRLFGAQIGHGVLVRPTARITYPWKLVIEDYAWIGDHAELYTLGPIVIGRSSVISQHAYLCTGSHDAGVISFDIYALPITIHAEAWVCAGAFVSPGVTVARGSIVGARSVLTRDTETYTIYAGVPARPLGPRPRAHG